MTPAIGDAGMPRYRTMRNKNVRLLSRQPWRRKMKMIDKSLAMFAAALLAVLLVHASPAAAECGGNTNVPPGSYRQTCSNCTASGGDLTAWCRTISNRDNHSTLFSVQSCRSSIENKDGYLTCAKGDAPLPGGSYPASCRNLTVEHNTLSASCRNVNGDWKETSLQLGYCNYQIYNADGVLACTLPYGTYQRSCRDAHVFNGTLSAQCRTRSGAWVNTSGPAACTGDISNNDGRLVCQ